MCAVVLQCASGTTGGWHTLPIDPAALADVTSCPVCTEEYYGASSLSTPRAMCAEGHTCCEACYRKLATPRFVKCPTCRRVGSYAYSVSETAGLCGTLLRRGLLRWACGTGCGFGGRLIDVNEHVAACGDVVVGCRACGDHQGPRSSLCAHVTERHADVVVDPTGRAARLSLDESCYIKLPFDMLAYASRCRDGDIVELEVEQKYKY